MSDAAFKRPESVLVVIHAADGQVLLMERTAPRGFWQSVTGSLRPGESPLAAARRELAEETGIIDVEPVDCRRQNVFPILPAWRARYAPDVSHNTEHVFRVELVAPREPRLNPAEHVALRWLPRAEAMAAASSWTDREAIRDFVLPGRDMTDGI